MLLSYLSANNLSQKMLSVVFSIYLVVTFLITSLQFLTEYLKTQNSIYNELKQLEESVLGPISTSLWQYNQTQLEALIAGLIKIPIIEGVDVFDKDTQLLISKRAYPLTSPPLSTFNTKSNLNWDLNGDKIHIGTLVLYSSSEVILDRVWFGFALLTITAVIKLSILFWLFIWAFDRYLAIPLKELMLQVNDVQQSQKSNKRINLTNIENNELSQLQDHMNNMLSAIERDREQLLENEQVKRNELESAVKKRTKDLQLLNEKLKTIATIDSLTGVLNRGSFFETAQRLLLLSQRQNSFSTFVLMDLDHFKKINDTYGHFTGDQVLIHFTDRIQTLLRKSDLIGRIGGEEFTIFLPNTGIEEAFLLADKIRKAISDSILNIDGKTVRYTVSLGIESSSANDQSVDELFKRADLKLYSAKNKGRNRVEK